MTPSEQRDCPVDRLSDVGYLIRNRDVVQSTFLDGYCKSIENAVIIWPGGSPGFDSRGLINTNIRVTLSVQCQDSS